jgi:hypothetical protein
MLKLIQQWFGRRAANTPPKISAPGSNDASRLSDDGRDRTGWPAVVKTLFIPLGGDSDVLLSRIGELESLLATPADEYRISILGPEGIMPDTALAMFYLIKQRPHPGRVVIQSLGSLLNSDVLVWLAGDERTLRPGAWIRFEPLPYMAPNRPRRRQPAAFRDYAYVLQLVGQYLPGEFAERAIYSGEIAEWDLIDQQPPIPTGTDSK